MSWDELFIDGSFALTLRKFDRLHLVGYATAGRYRSVQTSPFGSNFVYFCHNTLGSPVTATGCVGRGVVVFPSFRSLEGKEHIWTAHTASLCSQASPMRVPIFLAAKPAGAIFSSLETILGETFLG